MSDLVKKFKRSVTPWVYRGLAASVRVDLSGAPDPGSGMIFAGLHRDMIPAVFGLTTYRPALLVSRSDDGEILIRTLAPYGFGFVRGSTGKEGGAAFRGLLGQLAAGRSVGIAVDGPRGPYGKIHDGALRLARRSGAPIVPMIATPGAHLTLKTWDRTVIPAPGSRLSLSFGSPISVSDEPGGLVAAAAAVRAALLGGAA